MNTYGVIMAGGGGTRFWPLSRQNTPKQVLNLSGKDVMINETIHRLAGLIDPERVLIVTNQGQAEILRAVVDERVEEQHILQEPIGRNTSPCIGYAALTLQKKYGDSLMVVLPADHYIKDEEAFRSTLGKALGTAEETEKLITIGITPTFPCTGYGYIHYDKNHPLAQAVYKVQQFVEKPNRQKAGEYVQSGEYLWNSGMFVWKTSVILQDIERFLPRLYDKLMELEPYIGTEEEQEVLARLYPQMDSISIDYGIMERSNSVLVLPGDFGWNDVGSWDSLETLYDQDPSGNTVIGDHIQIETSNTLIYGKDHMIAVIGLDNMVVVHTEDATLVCPKERAQDVKHVVEKLKEQRKELL